MVLERYDDGEVAGQNLTALIGPPQDGESVAEMVPHECLFGVQDRAAVWRRRLKERNVCIAC